MKKDRMLMAVFCAFGLTACATAQKSPIHLSNPASEFCVEVGGESVRKTDTNGKEYGVCRFADGNEMEEWEFYRKSAAIIISGDTIKR